MRITKAIKRFMLSALCAVFALVTGLFVGSVAPLYTAVAETEAMYCDGASIRVVGDGRNGIRFHVRVVSNEEGIVNLDGTEYSSEEFLALETGILLIPTSKLGANEQLTIAGATKAYASGAKAANVTGDECVWKFESDDDFYYYEATAYIYNIPESNYDTSFTFRGYYSVDGENYVYTKNTDRCTRSVSFVATRAKIDDNKQKAEDETTGLQDERLDALNAFLVGKQFTRTESFLYRIGNANAISMNSLFSVFSNITSEEEPDVYDLINFNCETIAGDVEVTLDETANTVKFDGTGIVSLTLLENSTKSVELKVEVVDAKNATSAMSATTSNIVLLNNVDFGELEVSGGYTLYGNGFKMSCTSDRVAVNLGYSFVVLNNGTLDNVQIICPNFDRAILYDDQMKASDNSETDSTGRTRYRNVRSAIVADGDNKIFNSYVSGGRAAVYARSGDLMMENTTVEGGAAASVYVGSSVSLYMKDMVLTQEPKQATVNDTTKTVMGFSVFVEGSADSMPPITLEGSFAQYAWAHEGYKSYVPEGSDTAINEVMKQTDYMHDITYADGVTRKSVNLGFASMSMNDSLMEQIADFNITDNRTDKSNIPYGSVTIQGNGKVFSYKNTNGTAESFAKKAEYAPEKQTHSTVLPAVSYNKAVEGITSETFYNATNGWTTMITVDLAQTGDYLFNFTELLVKKYGKALSYTIQTENGEAVEETILLNRIFATNYILTITDNQGYNANGEATESAIYTHYLVLNSTMSTIEAPKKTAEVGGDPLLVVKSKNGDWTIAVPVLDGVEIKYFSASEQKYATVALSSLTPSTLGKQNGTEKFWTYSAGNGDYSLTITSGYIHEGKQVFGMPVVVNNGGNKMYFTLANTNGYVSTGTSSRQVVITYEFTANGETLTFSKTWNVTYADYKSVAQYSYNDFINGTMTDTLTSGGGSSSSCITPETLITLADGRQVRVDSLKGDEMLLVWNMETGKLDSAPIMFIDSDPTKAYEVIRLYFSDGTSVNVISEHGFWDYDLNRYVYLDKNAIDYVGHTFAKQNGDKLEKVELVDVVIENVVTEAWSPVTEGHLCYFVNGMLSMPGGVGGLFNIFEVNAETMSYDYEAIARDIEAYGLFTYEELNAIVELPESMFNEAGGAYMKISIAKGNLTMEELIAMINRYKHFYA